MNLNFIIILSKCSKSFVLFRMQRPDGSCDCKLCIVMTQLFLLAMDGAIKGLNRKLTMIADNSCP